MARRISVSRSTASAIAVVAVFGVAGWALHGYYPSSRGVSVIPRAAAKLPVEAPPQTGAAASPPVLGGASEPMAGSRFELRQVIVPPASAAERDAEALIAVDGSPPRRYRVGDAVVGAVVLQSIQRTSASLGPAGGPAAVVLDLGRPGLPGSSLSGESLGASAGAGALPVVRPASAPAVDRSPVPVTDPDHGVDTSNH